MTHRYMRPLGLALAAVTLSTTPAALAQTAPASVTQVATGANPAADAGDQRIRCRRMPITGSLVRVERVCKTVAEWRRLSDRGNDVVRQQFENGLVCAGGDGYCRGN